MPIFASRERAQERNKGNEMRALPFLRQVTAPKRRLGVVDTWVRKPHQYPISGILDKMVDLLKNSFKPKGGEAGDVIS